MSVEAARAPQVPAAPPPTRQPPPAARDPWRPGPPLIAMLSGWVATFAWSGMVREPLTFLLPLGMLGAVMALVGSGLRVLRIAPYAVAAVQALVALIGLNLNFAARQSILGLIPTDDSLRQVFYVIGNGAATLNAYSAPVAVNPTHTRAFLMVCGLGVLFAIDVLAFGVRRPPLVALPLLVTLSIPVSILNEALALPIFVGSALLFLRLMATEHIDRLRTWGEVPAQDPAAWLATLWKVSISAIVVALVVAPFIPVADLLNDRDGPGGDGVSGGGQYRLTTVNPFIRLRRDLISKTHTPLLYAETNARETGYVRTTVLDQFRDDEWRPSARELPSKNRADGDFPSPPGLAPGVSGSTDEWSLRLAPDFATTWLPLPYPIRKLEIEGNWRFDSRTLDVAHVGGRPAAGGELRRHVVHPERDGGPPQRGRRTVRADPHQHDRRPRRPPGRRARARGGGHARRHDVLPEGRGAPGLVPPRRRVRATPWSNAAARGWTCSPPSSPTTGSATASSSRPRWRRWGGCSASPRGSPWAS